MMRLIGLSVVVLLGAMACFGSDSGRRQDAPQKLQEDLATRARRLARQTIIIDGHIDLPMRLNEGVEKNGSVEDVSVRTQSGDFDHPRALKGGLNAPFMSIYIPASYQKTGGARKFADRLIDLVEGLATSHPEKFSMAETPDAVEANFRAGRISLLMGIENGAAIEDDIANVEHFFRRGVRYITLTHSKDNRICDSSYDDSRSWQGLSDFGRQVVAEMNRIGIMVDISHVSDQTFYDVLEVATKPVIASHSSMRHFTPGFERNMSDDMVKALAANGGVVMINFGSTFVSDTARLWGDRAWTATKAFASEKKLEMSDPGVESFRTQWAEQNPMPRASVHDVANHIDHVVQLVGVDHVGFGSDFDGVGDTLPDGLRDASFYPKLIEVLLERGYSDTDIRKICSGNLLRVWRAQNNSR